MKKSCMLLLLFATTAAMAASEDIRIMFSTPGVDTYADGSTVLTGERYALVWKQTADAAFSIAADGTVTGGKVVLCYETKAAGRCSPVFFTLPGTYIDANKLTGGAWSVQLLDTRVKGADGIAFAPLNADGVPSWVNGMGAVASVTASAVPANATGTAAIAENSVKLPAPEIKSIEIKGASVEITVANTSAFMSYALEAGDAPATLAKAGDEKAGSGEDITFVMPKQTGAFFSVTGKTATAK